MAKDEGREIKRPCFAPLWDDATFADATLQLRSTSLPIDAPCCAALPVHRALLAVHSEYFETRLLRWDSSGSQSATKSQASSAVSHFSKTGKLPPGLTTNQLAQVCKEAKAHDDLKCVEACSLAFPDIAMDEPGSSQAPLPCLEETFDSQAECDAARLVVRCMYEGELAEEVKDPLSLARVCRVAERWAFSSLTSKCLLLLAGLPPPQLPAEQLMLVQQTLPDSCALLPEYQQWQQRVHHIIRDLYRDVHAVITSAQLRTAFQQLPFAAVQLWAGSDELTVDSENSVVELLSLWMAGPVGKACTLEQQQQLSCLVRVQHLSPFYAQGRLPELRWYNIPGASTQQVVLAAISRCGMKGLVSYPAKTPTAWSSRCRKQHYSSTLNSRTHICWNVSRQELVDLMASKHLPAKIYSEPVYSSGVGWRVYLRLMKCKQDPQGMRLGCYGQLATYAECNGHALGAKLPYGAPITFTIRSTIQVYASMGPLPVLWGKSAHGTSDRLNRCLRTAADLESFLHNGCLPINAYFQVCLQGKPQVEDADGSEGCGSERYASDWSGSE
ncbi:hypothetical protein V8C86DRAFT_3140830 [Haematococcus lacustris]